MKRRIFGIYFKVFSYTLLILVFVIFVMFAFFSDQIKSVVESLQQQQISYVFHPLLSRLNGKSDEEIIENAKRFHEKNASFEFCLEASSGRILYKTENFVMLRKEMGLPPLPNMIVRGNFPTDRKFSLITQAPGERLQFISLMSGGVRLYVSGTVSGMTVYNEFINKMIVAFAVVFLASIFAAAVFARRIAKPIQKIAGDTRKMSDLEAVPAPDSRKDEIGQLAGDVYKMYKTLKSAIRQLETEIEREKEMEETQRYFFAAASHELKTPIAATGALLEGMLENVIELSEYPAYLRECLKMTGKQDKLVSEILEIVALSNDAITQERKRVLLKEFITGILASYHTIAGVKGRSIDVDIPENLHCTFDTRLFSKAFSNVVMNAIQNTPEGGQVRIYAHEREKGIRLCILNKGASIPEEILPKLFKPFYREDRARSRSQGRSGLGLTIVKKALDLMEIPFALENTQDGVLFRMDLSC